VGRGTCGASSRPRLTAPASTGRLSSTLGREFHTRQHIAASFPVSVPHLRHVGTVWWPSCRRPKAACRSSRPDSRLASLPPRLVAHPLSPEQVSCDRIAVQRRRSVARHRHVGSTLCARNAAPRLERPVRRRPKPASGPASSAGSLRRASRAVDRGQQHALILLAEARHGNTHGPYSAGAAAAYGLHGAKRGASSLDGPVPQRAEASD
jgi:hypothetical protein